MCESASTCGSVGVRLQVAVGSLGPVLAPPLAPLPLDVLGQRLLLGLPQGAGPSGTLGAGPSGTLGAGPVPTGRRPLKQPPAVRHAAL